MRDIFIKGLQKAAESLQANAEKVAHVQDVVRRLETASEQYPMDPVIRHMEDIFRKRASDNPLKLVTADEFQSLKQDLWGYNPRSAVNEFFPDLVFEKPQVEKEARTHVMLDDSSRELPAETTSQELVHEARVLILKALKSAGVSHAQTKFVKGMNASYAEDGSCRDGVLMFKASVITKAGESDLAIPVVLEESRLVPPETFAHGAQRYNLTEKGIRDFALGLEGLAMDSQVDHEYVYGENELRHAPAEDDSAEQLVTNAKTKVFREFYEEAGVKNCQVRLGSFHQHADGSATMKFNVGLPFASEVEVPVSIESDLVFAPDFFYSTAGREYSITRDGVSNYVSDSRHEDVTPVATRAGLSEMTPRQIIAEGNENDFRGIISTKLASDLTTFGAINPQVRFATRANIGDEDVAAFYSSFGTKKGQCSISIPITIKGRKVSKPLVFFGEDEKSYEFSPSGLNQYMDSRMSAGPVNHTHFHGEQPDTRLASSEIDANAATITRQEGFETGERVLKPLDDRFAQLLAKIRDSLSRKLLNAGAVAPQVQYEKHASNEEGMVIRFGAAFKTQAGIKRALVPVFVSEAGTAEPEQFIGIDNQFYDFNTKGLAEYVSAQAIPTSDIEAEIANKLNLLSFHDVRSFLKQAMDSADHRQAAAAMTAISERFGPEAAQNCFADLTEDAQAKQNKTASECVGCPYFSPGSDPQSRTAKDMCRKFDMQVTNVHVGSHHSQCSLIKLGASQEEPFDGSIVTSQIKLT